jgi:hypothetical protein
MGSRRQFHWTIRYNGPGGNPIDVEAALLDEQECIEFQLGKRWFDRRDANF